jgi:hypothetical protein
MMLFIEKVIRGGISQSSNRYHKAINRYMDNDYNPQEETSFLLYFDVNNLYDVTMSFALPERNFHWVSSEDIYNENFMNISVDSDVGYILEVDLHCPKERTRIFNFL